jgi:[ribosomal protein S18]-alanine N-acetyltransferase
MNNSRLEPTGLITRLTGEDLDAVRVILEPSELHVDLQAELTRDIALPWVIRSTSGLVVGFLLAWSVADELHLLELASHPAYRRQGFARALLDALVLHARQAHKRLLLLEVRRSNSAAILLYESRGFERTGVRRGYYSDTGEDALEMRITFDPSTGEIVRGQS